MGTYHEEVLSVNYTVVFHEFSEVRINFISCPSSPPPLGYVIVVSHAESETCVKAHNSSLGTGYPSPHRENLCGTGEEGHVRKTRTHGCAHTRNHCYRLLCIVTGSPKHTPPRVRTFSRHLTVRESSLRRSSGSLRWSVYRGGTNDIPTETN